MQTAALDAHDVAPTEVFARCGKCDGGGQFIGRNGRALGECFACKGTGRAAPRFLAGLAAANAPTVNDEALRAAFDRASAAGLKRPRITLDGLTISVAPATGRNAGALYVKHRATADTEGAYLGKIMSGRFMRDSACTSEQAESIAALIADPKHAAEAYGQRTGRCCICSLELTDPESLERGIGPICASRFGF